MATFKIFGKNICINLINSEESTILLNELSIYPKVSQSLAPDITINYLGNKLEKGNEIVGINPAIHVHTKTGFVINMGPVRADFLFRNSMPYQIDFSIDKGGSILGTTIRRWRNIQFARVGIDDIGQLFHELILVPLAFFFKDYALVHASSIQLKDGSSILFGGTGGVGKTSLELELCKKKNLTFVSDDILPVNESGIAFPNLSYPKIYGYNIIDDEKVLREIFPSRFSANYFQWKLRFLLKGKSQVRRRVSPEIFYGKVENNSSPINSFYLLNRKNVKNIAFRDSSPNEVSKLNALVMLSEYGVFHNHILWHEFNALLENRTALITNYNQNSKNIKVLSKALEYCKCFIVDIPLAISHNAFKKQMVDLLIQRHNL